MATQSASTAAPVSSTQKMTIFVVVEFLSIFVFSLIIYKAFGIHSAKNYFPYAALISTIAISYLHRKLVDMSYGKLLLVAVGGGLAATLLLQLVNLF